MMLDQQIIYAENVCTNPDCDQCQSAEHDASCRCSDCESTKIDKEWGEFSDNATAEEMAGFEKEMEGRR